MTPPQIIHPGRTLPLTPESFNDWDWPFEIEPALFSHDHTVPRQSVEFPASSASRHPSQQQQQQELAPEDILFLLANSGDQNQWDMVNKGRQSIRESDYGSAAHAAATESNLFNYTSASSLSSDDSQASTYPHQHHLSVSGDYCVKPGIYHTPRASPAPSICYSHEALSPAALATPAPSNAGSPRRSFGLATTPLLEPMQLPSYASSAASSSPPPSTHCSSSISSSVLPYGYPSPDGTGYCCSYPGCASSSAARNRPYTFRRPCDLRKHYTQHRKHLFCRFSGCPQATSGGFSTNKDRARHEAKHSPGVQCDWEGCKRVFSRVDNMKDHVRRIHCRK